MFWETNIPSKIKVFCWRVLLNRLLSKDQLANRTIIQSDDEKVCVLCATKDEDLKHLLFKCSFNQKLWDKIHGWLELYLLEQAIGLNHLFLFTQGLKGKIKKKKMCLIWLATIWSIWNVIIKVIFHNETPVLYYVIMNIKIVGWIWHAIGNKRSNCTILYNRLHAPLDFLCIV